jgi:hypothetical protein
MKSKMLFVLYVVLGAAQIPAFLAGIELWLGVKGFLGIVILVVMMALPLGAIVEAAIAFYGVYHAWHWPLWQAALLTFPLVIIAIALSRLEGSANIVDSLVRRRW